MCVWLWTLPETWYYYHILKKRSMTLTSLCIFIYLWYIYISISQYLFLYPIKRSYSFILKIVREIFKNVYKVPVENTWNYSWDCLFNVWLSHCSSYWVIVGAMNGLPRWPSGKEPAFQCRRPRDAHLFPELGRFMNTI